MLVPCPACKTLIRTTDRDWHNERECPERKLNCRYCKLSFYFPDIKAHDEICPKFPMTCEACGKKKIPREKFQDHVKTCGRCKVPCRFQVVGCTEMVENDKSLEHESKCVADHLAKMLEYIHLRRKELGDITQRMGMVSVQGIPAPLSSMSSAAAMSSDISKNDVLRLEVVDKKSAVLENIVCVLNREVERCSLTMEETARQRRADQEKIDTLNAKVRQLERTLGQKEVMLAELETRVQEAELSTYDGIFVWKITDFAKKRQDAMVGRCPAMFSPRKSLGQSPSHKLKEI
ncbi:hypothetical protein GDO81_022178 [Engystomops pustulosus]|uniref:TRAF-type domain-containing protein n=1 Tax=Engystomops pustulosus TaxID=76066 RepID=A0AAV6Z6P6_ENGPU|nr:hypothetical protein GDO81_022178 [Engystomops pustulosus]KAG8544616.1 hypothetical protein GDO81_022178 [Engystomops pustulosus]